MGCEAPLHAGLAACKQCYPQSGAQYRRVSFGALLAEFLGMLASKLCEDCHTIDFPPIREAHHHDCKCVRV
jgi:hypothetical protein